jgi:iron(III) transport system permease protein
MGLVLALASLPLFFLFAGFSTTWVEMESVSIRGTLSFAIGGGIVSTIVGAAAGITAGTREFAGRRGLIGLSLVSIAAPPAFWWIGTTRLPLAWGTVTGPGSAALVAGLALSPITLLLVLAALRELPANLYEAARVSLSPVVRLRAVLIPILSSPLAGGFLLSVILLLGESELPFLFGFRTIMTDIVTTFSQTFDAGRTIPLIVPLLLIILVVGLLAGRPLIRAVLASSRGVHGVIRRPASAAVGLCAVAPAAFVTLSIGGYLWAATAATPDYWRNLPVDGSTAIASIAEPVGCAWITLVVALAATYPARGLRAMRYFLWIGLLLFFIPAAVYAIGWIRLSQVLGGVTVPPIVAHVSRAVGLPALGFAVAYSRLPHSLEDAARLVRVSPVRRAFLFLLPVLLPSLVASSALVAALTYADRDVASLLLSPGTSRLMLDLYLRSANAPSGTVGLVALIVLAGATLTVTLAAAGPVILWRRRA